MTTNKGKASFAFTATLPTGENVVSATDDLTGDTSEFSKAVIAS